MIKLNLTFYRADGNASASLMFENSGESVQFVEKLTLLEEYGAITGFSYNTQRAILLNGAEVSPAMVDYIRRVKDLKNPMTSEGVGASLVIPAIKMLREVHRAGLKDAKDCYDSI